MSTQDNLMVDRLDQMIAKFQEELNEVENRRTEILRQIKMLNFIKTGDPEAAQELIRSMQGRRTLSAAAKNKISKAQKARHAKGHNNAQSTRWTDADDKIIVSVIKSKGKVQAPEIARQLVPKITGRTEGAIRQRIARLADIGVLKQTSNGKGPGTPHMLVEAV